MAEGAFVNVTPTESLSESPIGRTGPYHELRPLAPSFGVADDLLRDDGTRQVEGAGVLPPGALLLEAALTDLLARAQNVTKILADRSTQLNTLLLDGNELLGELDRRRAAINQLVVYVDDVARQLSGLVADNEPQMRPTLDRLNSVLALLQRNEQNLNEALDGLGPYAAALGEQVGNGPWFNAYVVNATSTELRPLVDALVWPEQVPQDLIDIFTNPRTPYIAPAEEDPPR